MPTTGFHSEWVTEGQHRVLLECRASFPDDSMRFIAKVAVVTCDNNSEGRARVVKVFYDDKACIWTVSVVSTDSRDKVLEDALRSVLHTMFADGNCNPQVEIVEEGKTDSDHYFRTEHLSVQVGVAVDRWRHRDKQYMDTVEPPG